jgi:hypothetical protein
MGQQALSGRGLVAVKLIVGAVAGAAGGLVATAVALRSFEAGILGAIGGALAVLLGAAVKLERAA